MSSNEARRNVSSVLKTVASKTLEEEVARELEVPDPVSPEKTMSSLLNGGDDEDTEEHDRGRGT